MLNLSLIPAFEWAVIFDDFDDDSESGDEDSSKGGVKWKLPKRRKSSGLKGRTPKHPLNKRAYTC